MGRTMLIFWVVLNEDVDFSSQMDMMNHAVPERCLGRACARTSFTVVPEFEEWGILLFLSRRAARS